MTRLRESAGLIGLLPGAALSLLVGMLVGALLQVGSGRIEGVELAVSAAVGLMIFLYARGLSVLAKRRMDRLAGIGRGVALTALFGLAGGLAWMTVWMALALVGGAGGSFDLRRSWPSILITALLAVLVGFLFTFYERLRRDLTVEVSRRQAAEYAERELELARAMQRRLLPPVKIDAGSYRVAAANRAARWVAGDLYDVFTRGDGMLGVAVGDVAGKGVGVSLIMASVKAMLPLMAASGGPEDALAELNRVLLRDLGPREFVALGLALYEPASGAFQLANAGLPDPYLLRRGGEVTPIEVPGQRLPLGVRRDLAYVAVEGRLEPGDGLLLVTDGLPEARGANAEPLGYETFQRLLPRRAVPPEVWLRRVFDAVELHTGEELDDDWTALLLEREG